MKRVLILAYDFPPYVSVGGLRPYAWYRYLKEYGIYPIVVTRQWGNKYGNHLDYIAPGDSSEVIEENSEYGTILKTPYKPNLGNRIMLKYGESKFKLLRKLISAFFEFSQWIWMIGPKVQLYFAAKKYLNSNNVEAIIATGDPFILFRYASILSKKYKIPWIADYRDPWIQDKSRKKNFLLHNWEAFWEKKCTTNLNSIITVSSFVEKQISSLLKEKKFHILPNGFDPDNIENIRNISQETDILNIGFVGTIYDWHPLESFLMVCNDFSKNEKARININFYGVSNEEKINNILEAKYPYLKTLVSISPRLPNQLLKEKLASNSILILFNDYSILGTKIFDYLALKRLILLCYENDPKAMELKKKYFLIKEFNSESKHLQKDVIDSTNSGIIINDESHLYEYLKNLYMEFQENGFISCNSVGIEKFSRKFQVKELSAIINNISSNKY
ncbi:glycosyltransferase [Flexithrix dorotheae]|uniref:glycosyltransferase n=1 Tax=Flexithrix dorotheae TaxID=70993 RepID=UPI00036AB619|nr:glycosyltransferase [Flexithrix dorotheae]